MSTPTGHTCPPQAAALVPGPVTTAWCPACKAWTRWEGTLLILTDEGVEPVGQWAWCETCTPIHRSVQRP